MKAVLIIPSYKPSKKLPELIKEFVGVGFEHIIVVNDGSQAEYDEIFDKVKQIEQVDYLRHNVNLGKGRALKTAFNHCMNEYPDCVGAVTADADGQHTPKDTYRVGEALEQNKDKLVLGVRNFKGSNVPKKSKVGNNTMCFMFRAFVGLKITDTQTGLRGIPISFMKKIMELKGERFEYETSMLIETKNNEVPITEVVIETVYEDNNSGTHFNPVRDSLKVMALLLKFVMVSIGSFIVDIGFFTLFSKLVFKGIKNAIFYSTYSARLISSIFNFICNKKIVFGDKGSTRKALLKYYTLCVIQATLSAVLVKLISEGLNWSEVGVKIFVDLFLFLLSFQIQRELIFKNKKKSVDK